MKRKLNETTTIEDVPGSPARPNHGLDMSLFKSIVRRGDVPKPVKRVSLGQNLPWEQKKMTIDEAVKVYRQWRLSEAYVGFKNMVASGTSPELAAWIGRKKYGDKKFQKAAKSGKTLRNAKH